MRFHLYLVARIAETESRVELARGGGKEGRGAVFSGCRVSLLQDEKRSGDGLYNHVNVPNTTVNCMICGVF